MIQFTEPESELLLLAIIELKEKWDKQVPDDMRWEHWKEISSNYESIINKVKREYEKIKGQFNGNRFGI